jgi:hypothetical protein
MKCPGQDTQYWKAGAIFEVPCPQCGGRVEFFKDDTTRKCGSCGHRFLNPKMDFGCAAYCQFAEQCIGDLPPELLAQKEDLLKDRVAIEVKRHFKTDFRKIGHAGRVARYAERIGRESGGNLAVIIPSAYLLHVGVGDARGVENGGAGAAAREILLRLGAPEPMIDAVCISLTGTTADGGGSEAPIDYQAVCDAERIAAFEDARKAAAGDAQFPMADIEKTLFTDAGRSEARAVLQS